MSHKNSMVIAYSLHHYHIAKILFVYNNIFIIRPLVAADGGCERDVLHRMNEGYRAWGALKSVLSNRGLGIKAKKCLYEGVIVPTALYGAEACRMGYEKC